MSEPDPPVFPFAATVAETRNLALEATEGRRPAGAPIVPKRIDDTQIGAWLLEGGGAVAAAIRGFERLDTQWLDPEDHDAGYSRLGQPELVASITARAKGLTQLYAGSLLATVTYPERTGKAQLGAVLYQRYLDGLAALTGEVRDELTRLSELEPPGVSAADSGVGGPDVSAPPPFLSRPGSPAWCGVAPWNAADGPQRF